MTQKEYNRQYYLTHRKQRLVYEAKYRASHLGEGHLSARLPHLRYSYAKSHCKNLKRSWDLTLTEYTVLISQSCHYCGLGLSNESGIGLDRIDNTQGYSTQNVLPCCKFCNQVRSNVFNVSEMKKLGPIIREIMENRGRDST